VPEMVGRNSLHMVANTDHPTHYRDAGQIT